MPVERLSHPSDGTSRKLCALSDFEFRVWCQYKLSANDVGVMIDDPAPLIAENKVLRKRGASAIRKALDRIVALEILIRFTDQGDGYLCSPVWQDYQTIRRPRETHLPIPSGSALDACSTATRKLFDRLLYDLEFAKRRRLDRPETPDAIVPDDAPLISETEASPFPKHFRNGDAVVAEVFEKPPRGRATAIAIAPALDLSEGQLRAAAPGLFAAWNWSVKPPLVPVEGQAAIVNRAVVAALRAHPDLDWWAAVFAAVAASDYLTGQVANKDGSTFRADFWWVLERAEVIASGRYANRPKAPPDGRAQQRTARNQAAEDAVIASLRAEAAR